MMWVADYIGQEWIRGENDCWAFFRKVQAEKFGRIVPVVDVDSMSRLACTRELEGHQEHSNWFSVDTPADGDAVLMGKNKHPAHIGLWVNGGVLHCLQGIGSVFQPPHMLELSGWNMISFYRHK